MMANLLKIFLITIIAVHTLKLNIYCMETLSQEDLPQLAKKLVSDSCYQVVLEDFDRDSLERFRNYLVKNPVDTKDYDKNIFNYDSYKINYPHSYFCGLNADNTFTLVNEAEIVSRYSKRYFFVYNRNRIYILNISDFETLETNSICYSLSDELPFKKYLDSNKEKILNAIHAMRKDSLLLGAIKKSDYSNYRCMYYDNVSSYLICLDMDNKITIWDVEEIINKNRKSKHSYNIIFDEFPNLTINAPQTRILNFGIHSRFIIAEILELDYHTKQPIVKAWDLATLIKLDKIINNKTQYS